MNFYRGHTQMFTFSHIKDIEYAMVSNGRSSFTFLRSINGDLVDSACSAGIVQYRLKISNPSNALPTSCQLVFVLFSRICVWLKLKRKKITLNKLIILREHIVEYSSRVSDTFVNVFTHTVRCIFVKVRPTNNEKVNMFGFSHLL